MPQSTPNYLTITPAGEAKAILRGGVEISAGTDNVWPSPEERRVSWVKESSGALVADITARNVNAASEVEIRNRQDNGQGQNYYRQHLGPNGASAYIQMHHPLGGGITRTAYLMDHLGQSSFVQWSNYNNRKIQTGTVALLLNAGWGTYGFNWETPFNLFHGFVCLPSVSGGATINGMETFGGNTTGATVNLSSAIAQWITLFFIAWGT